MEVNSDFHSPVTKRKESAMTPNSSKSDNFAVPVARPRSRSAKRTIVTKNRNSSIISCSPTNRQRQIQKNIQYETHDISDYDSDDGLELGSRFKQIPRWQRNESIKRQLRC
eukprot:UN28831